MGSSVVGVESSSSPPNFDYDVFLSFRGEDTRKNFTSHLGMALRQKGVFFFIDDKLERGGQISESLLRSIEGSRISIIIFSPNYASSTWCLDELVKIIECMKSKRQIVLPVFYSVDPSEVRKQTGEFGNALVKHEANQLMTDKIQPWKEALSTAAGLSGWDLKTRKDEADLIQEIVKQVLCVVNRKQLLEVAKYPVGIDSQVRAIEESASHRVNMVGLYGIGGIGKTTLAKALYNKIASQFEGCCFLPNVREASKQFNGLAQLQEILLNDILKDDVNVVNHDRGINIIRNRLCWKKVLIVVDDVDNLKQLEALVGGRDWFGEGSKIIVTTRNKHLLSSHGFDETYGIRGLSHDYAIELFSWHAFKESHPPSSNYLDLSERATRYCKGLPLALVVLGSFLRTRDEAEWISILDRFENSMSKEIKDILQLSFDGLEDGVKEIFLDISCFFVGEEVAYAKKMLNACHLNLEFGIILLNDLSLITFEYQYVKMHDLIRQMGDKIVYGESSEAGKRSRLWLEEDIWEVFVNNSGTDAIKAINLDLLNPKRLNVDPQAFRKMKNLRLLMVRNARFCTEIKCLPDSLKWIKWDGFAQRSLPSCFNMKNLVGLELQHSIIQNFGKKLKDGERLKYVDLTYSTLLEQIPDFSAASDLEELHLSNCTNLRTVDKSVFSLPKLTILNLYGCSKFKKLPTNYFTLRYLKELNLSYCKKLEKIPDLSASSNLERLFLEECTNLRMIHESVGSLDKLDAFILTRCTNLTKLPNHFRLKSLRYLKLSGCSKLENFPTIDENMKSLEYLCLDFTAIKELPSSIGYLTKLPELKLDGCTHLISLPNTIYLLNSLKVIHLSGCSRFEMVSHKLDPAIHIHPEISFPKLTILDLESCNISNAIFLETLCNESPFLLDLRLSENKFSSLPSCLHKLMFLWNLELRNCKFLQEIPNLPQNIQNLDASGCESLARSPDDIMNIISRKQDDLTLGEISREFLLMDIEIPEWFGYKTTTNLMSASFRHYSDMERSLAAYVSFKVNGDSSKKRVQISCNIFICNRLHCSFTRPFLPSKSEYMWLVTTSLAWSSMEVNDCNEVVVWFEVHDEVNVTIRSCGVHVNEELHGIQTDLKWPVVNYADFFQPEKLQNLGSIEDVLVKRYFQEHSCKFNCNAMLHAGSYGRKAIDSNIQPITLPLHLTYNGYTLICGLEGMGENANECFWRDGHRSREALDYLTTFIKLQERRTNIKSHTLSSKKYFATFEIMDDRDFSDLYPWILPEDWFTFHFNGFEHSGKKCSFLIESVDTSL